jgi:hypothetical protein
VAEPLTGSGTAQGRKGEKSGQEVGASIPNEVFNLVKVRTVLCCAVLCCTITVLVHPNQCMESRCITLHPTHSPLYFVLELYYR